MLATLITSVISGEAIHSLNRAKRGIAIYLIAGLLSLAGLGFLIGAAFIALARRIGHIEAALAFGVAFFLIAMLLILIHRVSARRTQKEAAERRKAEVKTLAGATAIALLPTLLSRGGLRLLALPALGTAALAIYRENSGERPLRRRTPPPQMPPRAK